MRKIERTSPPSRFRGLKVLVVEDETIVSFLVEDMLKDLGCAEVWHACSVREALQTLRQRHPDAAVLDVNLAGEFAYAVAEQLDAMQVPFIFATGYGQAGILTQWAPRPVIQKPFPIEALAAALASVLDANGPPAVARPRAADARHPDDGED